MTSQAPNKPVFTLKTISNIILAFQKIKLQASYSLTHPTRQGAMKTDTGWMPSCSKILLQSFTSKYQWTRHPAVLANPTDNFKCISVTANVSIQSFASRDIFEELRIFLLLFLAFRSWGINSLKPEYKVLPYLVKIGFPITSTQPAVHSGVLHLGKVSSLPYSWLLLWFRKRNFILSGTVHSLPGSVG